MDYFFIYKIICKSSTNYKNSMNSNINVSYNIIQRGNLLWNTMTIIKKN